MSDRDYFAGCHNVPMFDTDEAVAVLAAGDELDRYLAERAAARQARSALEIVREIAASQLELPAELLPVPAGRLFS